MKYWLAAQVKRRALGLDGTVVGNYHNNPKMNSIVHEVEFPSGQVKEYAANVIAEHMLSQINEDGYSSTLMESIVDHMKDEATTVSIALGHSSRPATGKKIYRRLEVVSKSEGWIGNVGAIKIFERISSHRSVQVCKGMGD
jgi:hypothetical protein